MKHAVLKESGCVVSRKCSVVEGIHLLFPWVGNDQGRQFVFKTGEELSVSRFGDPECAQCCFWWWFFWSSWVDDGSVCVG